MLAAVRRMMLAAATAALLHAREMVRTVRVQATACLSGGCLSVCRSVGVVCCLSVAMFITAGVVAG